jgi:MscS family membrane protein
MNKILNQIFWDNSLLSYLEAFGFILVIWAFKKVLSRFLARLLYSFFKKTWKGVERAQFTVLIAKPLGFFILMLVTVVSLYKLRFPSVLEIEIYKYTTKQIVHSLGTFLFILSFTKLLLRGIDFLALLLEKKAQLTPDLSDDQLIVFFKDFFKVIIVIFSILLVVRFSFNINVGGVLTGLSIVGAAIALALRESLENLIASFIIFFDKPFITGDLVKVNAITGTVEKIGLRSTRIRTEQKTFVTVPNKQMVDNILDNLSLRTQRRVDLKIELSSKTATDKLALFLEGVKKILQRKEIENFQAVLSDLTAASFVVSIDYYTATIPAESHNLIKQEINMQVIKLMEELKIELPQINKTIVV